MNSKKLCFLIIVILIVLLIVFLFWKLVIGRNTQRGPQGSYNPVSSSTGTNVSNGGEATDALNSEPTEKEEKIATENITTPEEFEITDFKVTTESAVSTLVTFKLTNKGTKDISKDEVLNIELFDKDKQSLCVIGATIEEDEDIKPGESTNVRAPIVASFEGYDSAIVKFDNSDATVEIDNSSAKVEVEESAPIVESDDSQKSSD